MQQEFDGVSVDKQLIDDIILKKIILANRYFQEKIVQPIFEYNKYSLKFQASVIIPCVTFMREKQQI